MSSYNNYRNGAGWGTKQFQFPAPPLPGFQPQPGWHGQDYFRAHAGTPDLSLYNNAWNRVRDYPDIDGPGFGVGLNEARHWHSRAYGGLGNASQMAGADLGHAAAYEAYRTWMHSSYLYEPLSGDTERQREGLVGLAIAEATRLLQYAGRGGYERVEACDAAAATASMIFSQNRRNMSVTDQYGGRAGGRSRSNSFSGYGAYPPGVGGSSYGGVSPAFGARPPSPYAGAMGSVPSYMGSSSGDPYAADNTFMYPAHHRSRSHSRSHSHSRHHGHRSRSPAVIMAPGGGAGYPMAIPGSVVQPGYGGGGGSYGAYGQAGMSPYRQPSPMQMYGGGSGGGGMGYPGSVPGVQTLPAGTMVIPSSSSRRRHRHSTSSSGGHHHHRRSSSDGYQQGGYPAMGVPGYAGTGGYRY